MNALYRTMILANSENHLLHYKQLLNQFIVDMYAKIENEHLRYIRCNQKALKIKQYIHLISFKSKNVYY